MHAPKGDLKWFGEGFDGFPKVLPEDCVEYTVYSLDLTLTDLERREKLRQVQTAGVKLTNQLLKDFIWQRESFKLSLERKDGRSFLRGRTSYGDSVEDEWLIVYILRELSKQFPTIWIRLADNDGQFLLVEAANALPRWLNPEIADFRVWLNRGSLSIIPLEKSGEEMVESKSRLLTLDEALNIIEDQPSKLLQLPAVEAEAFHRLQRYPKQIADSLHHALVTIPRNLAFVLHEDPSYISGAVEAFYLRDPIALRPLQISEASGLLFPPKDLVTMSMKFTKVGYAQLKSQQFAAPAPWVNYALTKRDPKAQDRAEMGMKVTCGFEMLMHDPQNQDRKAVREIEILLDDIRKGEGELPTDAEITKWEMRQDDETWLDINFEDFERELQGNGKPGAPNSNKDFGDKGAQENLRKIVARFEDFLKDDAAGADGAEFLDEMDNDEDEIGTISDDSDDGGTVSFDDEAFASMMREMMSNTGTSNATPKASPHEDESGSSVSSDEENDKEMHQAMLNIESELREAGALNLDLKSKARNPEAQCKAIEESSSSGQSKSLREAEDASEDEDASVDFTLAKNLLESFKSQGGMSGPGGNIMNLMGMRLPRDEDTDHGEH